MKRTEWIAKQVERFAELETKNPMTIGAVCVGRRVAVMDLETGAIGVATCSPTDTFDLDTGISIAFARMMNDTIPKSVITGVDGGRISELKNGQRFRYLGEIFIYCGVDETWRHRNYRNSRRHEPKYMVYSETKKRMFWLYDADGAEIIDD